MKLFFIFSTVVGVLFLNTGKAQAQIDPKSGTVKNLTIGTVQFTVGKVWLVQEGRDPREVSKLVKIVPFDTIKTEEKSVVKIKMVDDTIIDVGPNSTFVFKEFEMKDKNDRKSTYSLVEGNLRALFQKEARSDGDLKVEARKVSMGIRGTEILAKVTMQGEEPVSEIVLLSGQADLDISQLGVEQKHVAIEKGQFFSTQAVGPRAPASETIRTLNPEQMKKFERGTSAKDLEEATPLFLDQLAFNETKPIVPGKNQVDGERLPASPGGQVQESGRNPQGAEVQRLPQSEKTPWYQLLKEQQNTRKKKVPTEEEILKWATPKRGPASTEETRKIKRIPCSYKSVCVQETPYQFSGKEVLKLCKETRLVKYPEGCK